MTNKQGLINYLVQNITHELYEQDCLDSGMKIKTMNVVASVLHEDLLLDVLIERYVAEQNKKEK